jgi:hypothetical protein
MKNYELTDWNTYDNGIFYGIGLKNNDGFVIGAIFIRYYLLELRWRVFFDKKLSL